MALCNLVIRTSSMRQNKASSNDLINGLCAEILLVNRLLGRTKSLEETYQKLQPHKSEGIQERGNKGVWE